MLILILMLTCWPWSLLWPSIFMFNFVPCVHFFWFKGEKYTNTSTARAGCATPPTVFGWLVPNLRTSKTIIVSLSGCSVGSVGNSKSCSSSRTTCLVIYHKLVSLEAYLKSEDKGLASPCESAGWFILKSNPQQVEQDAWPLLYISFAFACVCVCVCVCMRVCVCVFTLTTYCI